MPLQGQIDRHPLYVKAIACHARVGPRQKGVGLLRSIAGEDRQWLLSPDRTLNQGENIKDPRVDRDDRVLAPITQEMVKPREGLGIVCAIAAIGQNQPLAGPDMNQVQLPIVEGFSRVNRVESPAVAAAPRCGRRRAKQALASVSSLRVDLTRASEFGPQATARCEEIGVSIRHRRNRRFRARWGSRTFANYGKAKIGKSLATIAPFTGSVR